MPDDKPAPEVDVTKEWRATHGQKSAATRLRLFAALAVFTAGVIFATAQRLQSFDHSSLNDDEASS